MEKNVPSTPRWGKKGRYSTTVKKKKKRSSKQDTKLIYYAHNPPEKKKEKVSPKEVCVVAVSEKKRMLSHTGREKEAKGIADIPCPS